MQPANLSDRLWTRCPYGGSRYRFKYRGQAFENKSTLIWTVAERFSERFGALTGRQANDLYARLARKYCQEPRSTLRSLEHIHLAHIVHPSRLNLYLPAPIQVNAAMHQAQGRYCVLESAQSPCRVCGTPTRHTVISGPKKKDNDNSRDGVCLHTRCRALLELFPRAFNSRKYYQFPLISVIQEITKNENNDENKRRLERHFVRRTR